ncbi:MAG: DUF3006 domain-containing protein [Acidobacteria bacterium]|nr:DUF3006 domain-containing protein [Acidobacteriota bacterium]MCW5968279.1 DUF3006 domain-containing protein [Blastocatellales bacterium]
MTTKAEEPNPLIVFVDRIEEHLAVLIPCDDDEVQLELPLKYLPPGIEEGSMLRLRFEPAPEEEEDARARIEKLQKELTSDQDPDQMNFKL